jgi:hypothetical protein
MDSQRQAGVAVPVRSQSPKTAQADDLSGDD